jgi:hypothetical protein
MQASILISGDLIVVSQKENKRSKAVDEWDKRWLELMEGLNASPVQFAELTERYLNAMQRVCGEFPLNILSNYSFDLLGTVKEAHQIDHAAIGEPPFCECLLNYFEIIFSDAKHPR